MHLSIRQVGKREIRLEHSGEKNCYELLAEHGITFEGACGGRGRCGKCRVRFCAGAPDPKAAEISFFTEEELLAGWRLACCCGWSGDAVVEVGETLPGEMKILTVESSDISGSSRADEEPDENISGDSLAVDIGTTTIAIAFFDSGTGRICGSESCVNSGRIYGMDVLSRIASANDGKAGELQRMLRDDILAGCRRLVRKQNSALPKVRRVAISGNTTMQHLLLGYSCKNLGCYPFLTEQLAPKDQTFEQVFGTAESEAIVSFMPGVSAFIGGDIVSGVYESGMADCGSTAMLLDLGTNGEMVIGGGGGMKATSVAAGPALEAGNITCGVPGVPGAISHVHIEDGRVRYETIGKRTPIGICGSGVLEIVAELLRIGLIDAYGTFTGGENQIIIVNGIAFTQSDIRQVQMAKAAIRAGIELLTEESGITPDRVDKIYLAGGFGCQMREETAIRLGMIPQEWKGRTVPLGNSSLKGAMRSLVCDSGRERTAAIARRIEEQNLAQNLKFGERYLACMNFS